MKTFFFFFEFPKISVKCCKKKNYKIFLNDKKKNGSIFEPEKEMNTSMYDYNDTIYIYTWRQRNK